MQWSGSVQVKGPSLYLVLSAGLEPSMGLGSL